MLEDCAEELDGGEEADDVVDTVEDDDGEDEVEVTEVLDGDDVVVVNPVDEEAEVDVELVDVLVDDVAAPTSSENSAEP